MRFIREIPEDRITQEIVDNLDQFGFTLIYTKDSIEVWAETKEKRI